MILEQVNDLNKQVEILLKQPPTTAPVIFHQGSGEDDAVTSNSSGNR